jgi:hypothetical protein
MEIKGQWILKNIKTYWILMLFPTKRILFEYRALVLKLHQDVGIINHPIYNMFFCDLEVMFGLSYIMAMLEGLNELIKLS